MTGWHDLAACAGMDPNLFVFQEPRSHLLDAKVIAAKAACADCPVRAECLADAMTFDAVGVWGGLSEGERKVAARRSVGTHGTPPDCGTRAGYRRHVRHHEPIDAACLEAHRVYNSAWRAAKRDAA